MDQTLIIHHLFTVLALVLMISRLVCRRIVFSKFDSGDFCTMAAMLCAATRGGIIHVVLTWGTNNMPAAVRAKTSFTSLEIYRRTVGSKLAITNRPIYNTYLWLQKAALLNFFLHHMDPSERWKQYIFWSYGSIFVATWVAAQIVGFTECDPFHLYWQVVPAPGRCVQAQVQLLVLGVLNIITDVMLLALPLPMLSSLRTPWRTKMRLYSLFTLGIFIIAITIIRLPINAMHAAVQANRTTWASTELLAAAIVVNAPVLYGSFNLWRQRSHRTSQRSAPRESASSTAHTIGSAGKQPERMSNAPKDDEELMLRPRFQASITSGTSYQDAQSEDVTAKKSVVVSYDNASENRASALY